MSVAAVERCISLIEALAAEPGGMPLGEVAARFKLPKSAVHRILSVLEERGWVMQDRLSQQYALSLRCAMLAFRNLDARGLPDMAQQVLDALAQTTREYCRLAIVEGEGLSWIARAQGAPAGLRYDPDLGQEVVLHATATGKAWLATLPEDEAVRLCARELGRRHHGLGPRRLRTLDALARELEETRRRGCAIAVEEGEPGVVAVATAFRAEGVPDAPVVGTLSVAGPLVRMPPERRIEIARALHRAAAEMEAVWPIRRRQRAATIGPADAALAGGLA